MRLREIVVESRNGGRVEPDEMPTLEERVAELEAKMKPEMVVFIGALAAAYLR